jgi:hypothetical protein
MTIIGNKVRQILASYLAVSSDSVHDMSIVTAESSGGFPEIDYDTAYGGTVRVQHDHGGIAHYAAIAGTGRLTPASFTVDGHPAAIFAVDVGGPAGASIVEEGDGTEIFFFDGTHFGRDLSDQEVLIKNVYEAAQNMPLQQEVSSP